MSAPRTIASNAAPAGRRDQNEIAGTTRPELHVVKGTRAEGNGVKRGVEQLITWTRTRSTPLLHLVIAVVFLGVCLVGSLMLRTQMVQEMGMVPQKGALTIDLNGYQPSGDDVQ